MSILQVNDTSIPDVLPPSIPIPNFIVTSFSFIWYHLYTNILRIPGGPYIIHYINKSYDDDPYRTWVEIGLVLYAIYYYLSKPRQKKGLQSNRPKLSPQEVDSLIDEWQPELLVENTELSKQSWRLASIPEIVDGGIDTHIDLTRNFGKERFNNVFNMASNNFLQMSKWPEVIELVKKTIKNYGVGACGPAGFYGNQDLSLIHI